MQDILSLNQWLWVDYGIAGILVVSAVMGLLRGFFREILAIVTWFIAIWVSIHYSHHFASVLEDKISDSVIRVSVAGAILFFATLIFGGMINLLVSQLLQKSGLSGTDRIIGIIFGAFRGALVVTLLVMLAGLTPLPKELWWKQSKFIPPFQFLAIWLKERMPSNLAASINYR